MGTSDIATEIKTLIMENNLADRTWLGMPNKIPKNSKTIIVIEPYMNPTYYYTTCPQQTTKDQDYYITILTKGKDEIAHTNNWDTADQIETLLLENSKLNQKVNDSTIEDIIYGDTILNLDGVGLIAASRITLRCKT
nr:hypothetical protein [Methanobrevibacter arboriphilus]